MIQRIRTNEAYKTALKLAYSLMDAQASTEQANQLEVLSIAIEKYENHHFPIEESDSMI